MTPEVIPPRVPQYNWVDLGLPSGTLWLDRLVGAASPSSPGLYYQWGSINGHTATDEFSFDDTSYSEQGLDTVDSDLSDSQDAARAFYGPSAKMPSSEQVQELIEFTSVQSMQNNVLKITSIINGQSISLYRGGFMDVDQLRNFGFLRTWLTNYRNEVHAVALLGQSSSLNTSTGYYRINGLNIMAIHS